MKGTGIYLFIFALFGTFFPLAQEMSVRRKKDPAGAVSQPVEENEAGNEEGEYGAAGGEGEEKQMTLTGLADILRAHMAQQVARDEKQREITTRQEQRFKALNHHFQLLQIEVQARTSPTPDPLLQEPGEELEDLPTGRPPSRGLEDPHPLSVPSTSSAGQVHSHYVPRLEKLTDNDDIEHFLVAFERIAIACRWQKPDWVFHLMPLLAGKAKCLCAYGH